MSECKGVIPGMFVACGETYGTPDAPNLGRLYCSDPCRLRDEVAMLRGALVSALDQGQAAHALDCPAELGNGEPCKCWKRRAYALLGRLG